MTEFAVIEPETADEKARALLEKAGAKFGFVPNVLKVMAAAPALLEGYLTLSGLFDQTSFSPAERQLILLAISRANRCHYCVAAHSTVARMAGLPDEVIAAVRDGREIAGDARLEALRRFVTEMVDRQGFVDDKALSAFLAAGFDKRQVLEIVLAIGLKVLSNYTNHLAQTPLDEPLKAAAWTPPAS